MDGRKVIRPLRQAQGPTSTSSGTNFDKLRDRKYLINIYWLLLINVLKMGNEIIRTFAFFKNKVR